MFKYVLPALAGVMLASAAIPAYAADIIIEEPVYEPKYVEPKAFGGWYLRGHIGMSNQRLGSLYNILFDSTTDLVIVDKNFEAGVVGGVGLGYQFNDWFRVDGLVEYRGEAGFHGMDTWVDDLDDERFNLYTAKKSEWLFMANAYADLGTFKGLTPYIGAGLGASRVTIHSFRDAGIARESGLPTLAYAGTDPKWNFAWALHAGLGIDVTDNTTLDLGYSFVHLGDGRTGDIIGFDGSNGDTPNPMHFRDITSHDFKLGLRYKF